MTDDYNVIYDALKATIKDSINDCIYELHHVDYATCIDHWQQICIDPLYDAFEDVRFYSGGSGYANAVIIINDNEFDLESIYKELTND